MLCIGKLPASFIELTNLEGLYLFDNFIEGKIPDELCELPRLCGLYMFNNNFEGMHIFDYYCCFYLVPRLIVLL